MTHAGNVRLAMTTAALCGLLAANADAQDSGAPPPMPEQPTEPVPPPPPPPGQVPTPPPGYGPVAPPPAQGYDAVPPPPAPAYPPVRTYGPLGYLPQEPPDARSHKGLLLRLVVGVGFSKMKTDDGGGLTIQGAAFQSALQIGGAVGPINIFADFFNSTILAPKFKDSSGTLGTASDVTVNGTGFGVGLGYYFPRNVHLSASFGGAFAQLADAFGYVHGQTNLGFGTHFLLGKEWWIAPEWGLGVAGEGMFLRVTEDGPHVLWKFSSFGLAFTATYQ